jgi:hypothetical protein
VRKPLAKRVARPAGLEPATSWFVARRKEATWGSGTPLPLAFRPNSPTWGNCRTLRGATICQSFVSHSSDAENLESKRSRGHAEGGVMRGDRGQWPHAVPPHESGREVYRVQRAEWRRHWFTRPTEDRRT